MNINQIVKEFIESDKPIEEFMETIESTDIGDTPEKSPKPSKKKKKDDENVEDAN